MTGKVPILEAVRAGFAHTGRTFKWSAIAAVLIGAPSGAASWVAIGRAVAGDAGGALGWSLLSTLLLLPFLTAHLRVAARGEPFGLSVGADEIRLLAAQAALIGFNGIVLLVGLFFSFFLMALLIGAVGVTLPQAGAFDPAALREALGAKGQFAASIAFLPLLLVLVWIGLRLLLVNPATIGARRVRVFETWSWTKGNVLALFASLILVVFPMALLLGVISGLLAPALGVDANDPATQLGYTGLAYQCLTSMFSLLLVAGPVLGLSGYLYRGLNPE